MAAEAASMRDSSTLHRRHVPVLIVGAGQAGLSVSYCLKQAAIDHLVLEKHRIGHAWRNERWDSFCLVTPNWQCRLPGFSYTGADPGGFMVREEIVSFIDRYAAIVQPPIREGVTVDRISPLERGGYHVHTSAGAIDADSVVIAISGYHTPFIPPVSKNFPSGIVQVHSNDYRNPALLPDGDVLVVGSGQSGCQIAEDLHLAGRRVHLAIGDAPRSPRKYRGRDVTEWLDDSGHYDMPIDEHPLGKEVRRNENHYMTGRDGGREIDLRRFAMQGMKLYGRLAGVKGSQLRFEPNLTKHLDHADDVYCRIRRTIDSYIANAGIDAPPEPGYAPCWAPEADPLSLDLAASNITSIVWSTGFRSDFRFIDVPAFDERGYPEHTRGVSIAPDLYFIGLPWMHTWGSGRFRGVARDAAYIADCIAMRGASLRAWAKLQGSGLAPAGAGKAL